MIAHDTPEINLARAIVDEADTWRGDADAPYGAPHPTPVRLARHVLSLHEAIRAALNELGVPNENYPANVANAVQILTDASNPASSPVATLPVCSECAKGHHVYCLDDGTSTAECRCPCREDSDPASEPDA